MAKLGEQFYTDSIGTTSASFRDQATISRGDSTPKHVGGEWRVPCTIRDATAIGRQSVCWPLKKHTNLITANFASLWPPHVFSSPVKMRQ
jgi:hypothetical protein